MAAKDRDHSIKDEAPEVSMKSKGRVIVALGLLFILPLLSLFCLMVIDWNTAHAKEGRVKEKERSYYAMKIRVKANTNTFIFELNNSPAAKDFYAMLPLRVQVENYSTNEKIFYLPKKLNISETPEADPEVGALTYYAPWGNVAIFYGEAERARGLYELGRCVSGIEHIAEMSGTIEVERVESLSELKERQKAVIPIAAFAASGDLTKLKAALSVGLDAGLTVNEIKEILVQLYAYAGFPRSLNALSLFMEVVEERKKKGIQDAEGKEAESYPAGKDLLELGTQIQTQLVGRPVQGPLFTFVPAIDRFLKEHLFGAIFGRDNLDYQTREIATLAALSNMEGVDSQLAAHFKISMNVGLTEEALMDFLTTLDTSVGRYQAGRAAAILAQVLGKPVGEDFQEKIAITQTGSTPPRKGPDAWFTGSVSIDTPFKVPEPAAFAGANVMFEPGSRTAWRSHVRGQLLIVTSGKGRVQQWGGPVQEIQKGDVVWFPPGVKHWHGAAPDSPMTHIAIVDEGGSGDATHWMEKVTDEQ